MPKRTKAVLLALYKGEEGINKITTIKNGLKYDTIKTFPQIFATIAKSNLQTLLGNEFYAFDKKIADPGRFSLNEIEIMAEFFQIEYEVMHAFIRANMINAKKKTKGKVNIKSAK